MPILETINFITKFYWKTAFVLIYPFALSPIFLLNNTPEKRCLYMIFLMIGFYLTEALPPQITSLLPPMLLPLMNLANSSEASMEYMNETSIIFFVVFTMTNAAERVELSRKVALRIVQIWIYFGCGPRKLLMAICFLTSSLSWCFSYTIVTTLIISLMQNIFDVLEENEILRVYDEGSQAEDVESYLEDKRIPSKTTVCFFLSIAYSASIGGNVSTMRSESKLHKIKLKDYFPGLELNIWKLLIVDLIFKIIMVFLTALWMQFRFLGLFRLNDNGTALIISEENLESLKGKVEEEIIEKRGLNFKQWMVIIFFIFFGCLCVIQSPIVFDLWIHLLPTGFDVASVGMLIIILLYLMPSSNQFIYAFSSDEEKRPKSKQQGIILWTAIQRKFPWRIIFLIGSGFDVLLGLRKSKLDDSFYRYLDQIQISSQFLLLVFITFIITVSTQFANNIATGDFFHPVLKNYATKLKVHPVYFWVPGIAATQFSYCLPVSNNPNAQVAYCCNLSTWDMFWNGLAITILSFLVFLLIYPVLISIFWDVNNT